MPLLDHFHPPLSTRRHWHSFHNAWSTYLADDLNQFLPDGYFAEPNAQFGIEVDVATFSEQVAITPRNSDGESLVWQPRSPTATLPLPLMTDVVEVQIFNTQSGGPNLVGAIELVSPANKDRPTHRDAFTAKCQTYLQQGVGLIIVDLVATLSANLHHELTQRLHLSIDQLATALYAVAYRTTQSDGAAQLEIWQENLTIGGLLPTLPLCLKGGLYLPIELERTYQHTCDRQRIPM
jgi:hypothetical protein